MVDESYVSWDQISSLPPGVFKGLKSLPSLCVGWERVDLVPARSSSLPPTAFNLWGILVYRDLANAGLTSLPAGVFEGLDSLLEL